MKLDFDISAVSRFFRGILGDLGHKRLWPIAAVLLAAIVAVPFVLKSSSSPARVAQAPVPVAPPAPATTFPALNVQSTAVHSRISGRAHDPFRGAGSVQSSTSSASAAASPGTVSTATAPVSSSGGTSAASSGATTGSSSPAVVPTTSVAPATPAITPAAKPKPAPTGLTSTQSYDVGLSITNSAGGVDSIDPLKRLSVIPSAQQPLVIELGAAQGGKRVLFAVQPGTVVTGPGSCTPGPVDCEILSLKPGQTESVASHSATGVSPVALFSVAKIKAVNHSSVRAANKARETASAVGRVLLSRSGLSALSLFRYEPSLGAVADLRNLSVLGG
jgi:hypothetical protein